MNQLDKDFSLILESLSAVTSDAALMPEDDFAARLKLETIRNLYADWTKLIDSKPVAYWCNRCDSMLVTNGVNGKIERVAGTNTKTGSYDTIEYSICNECLGLG